MQDISGYIFDASEWDSPTLLDKEGNVVDDDLYVTDKDMASWVVINGKMYTSWGTSHYGAIINALLSIHHLDTEEQLEAKFKESIDDMCEEIRQHDVYEEGRFWKRWNIIQLTGGPSIRRMYNEVCQTFGVNPNDVYILEPIKDYNIAHSYDLYNVVKLNQANMAESKHINESMEETVEPNDINLSSFKLRNQLNPKIWDGDVLKSQVRLQLMQIADDFWKDIDIKWVEPEDAYLTGSICNYNWSHYSDIDLHLVVDFSKVSEKKEFVKMFFDSKKSEWNKAHEGLNVFGFGVETYVQDIDETVEAGGIYSLYTNKWVKEPEQGELEDLDNDESTDVRAIASEYINKIDDLSDEYEASTEKPQYDDLLTRANALYKEIKDNRKKSLAKDGEMGVWNIVFKVLRRSGHMGRLIQLRSEIYDKVMSL